MWWYRDTKKSPAAKKPSGRRAPAPAPAAPRPVEPGQGLTAAVAHVLAGRPRDPDAWLVMGLLVDSRIEIDGGAVSDGMTWHEAERTVAEALGPADPARLYNRFAREFGDGYTLREDLPEDRARALGALRDALASAPGVKTFALRTPRDVADPA